MFYNRGQEMHRSEVTTSYGAKIFIFASMLCIVLNPYTIVGNLGFYFTLLVIALFVFMKDYRLPFIIQFLGIITLSFFGVLSSIFNNILQLNHFQVAFSTVTVFYIGVTLGRFAKVNNISIEFALKLLNSVILLNCLIIILEIIFPTFRSIVESFLIGSGNRDWGEGFRYRGIASGGGAALSMLSPLSILVGFYLYKKGEYSLIAYIFFALVVGFSSMVIGRTGLVLSGLSLVVIIFMFVKGRGREVLFLLGGSFMVISICAAFIYPFIESILLEQYGEGFFRYSFGFLFDGREGIENEGTFSVLIGFLSVLPSEFPQIVTGYGFYGGSDFEPWTDSGLARTFLSLGIPLGLLFYIVLLSVMFYCFRRVEMSSIFYTCLVVLFLGELKEPMLYSGYASRVVILMCAFFYVRDYENFELNPRMDMGIMK